MTDTRSDAAGRIDGIRERAERLRLPVAVMKRDTDEKLVGFVVDRDKPECRPSDLIEVFKDDIPYLLTALQSALGRVEKLEAQLRDVRELVSKEAVAKYTLNGIIKSVRERTALEDPTP